MNKNRSPIIFEATTQIQSINSANYSIKKIKDLNAKRKEIFKKIKKMKKGLIILETNINSNKTTYGVKRIELKNKNLQILKRRRNVQLTRKSHSLKKNT